MIKFMLRFILNVKSLIKIDIQDSDDQPSSLTKKIQVTKNIIIKNLSKNFNLIVTPHIGGASFDSMKATEEFMADKLNNYLQSNKLFN